MSDGTEISDRPGGSPEAVLPTRKRGGRKPFQRTTYSDHQLTSLQLRFEEKRYLTIQERAGIWFKDNFAKMVCWFFTATQKHFS